MPLRSLGISASSLIRDVLDAPERALLLTAVVRCANSEHPADSADIASLVAKIEQNWNGK
jgi:hypothetical protein